MRSSLQDAYDAVDWEGIHAYMVLTNWKWVDHDGVPGVYDLQVTVSSLMEEVRRSVRENTGASTGGFAVNKWTFDSGTYYEIVFDIAKKRSL